MWLANQGQLYPGGYIKIRVGSSQKHANKYPDSYRGGSARWHPELATYARDHDCRVFGTVHGDLLVTSAATGRVMAVLPKEDLQHADVTYGFISDSGYVGHALSSFDRSDETVEIRDWNVHSEPICSV